MFELITNLKILLIMFGRIRNMNQVKIETEYEVLEHMIQDIPQYIQSEIDKLNEQISNDAKIDSENDQDIEVNMRSSDIRNYMMDILIEMKTYLYHSMIVMLYSYAETNMKNLSLNLSLNLGIKEDKCKIKRLYNRIKDNTNGLPDIECYWKKIKEFNSIRCSIVHDDIIEPNSKLCIDEAFLLQNAKEIKDLLLHVEQSISK